MRRVVNTRVLGGGHYKHLNKLRGLLNKKSLIITILVIMFIPILSREIEEYNIKSKTYNSGNNQVSYAEVKSELTNFYNKLKNKDTYVLSTDKFLCTGTNIECNTGEYTNIGLINKDELSKIGDSSYLIGTNNYWTMSKESSNVYRITSSGIELVAGTDVSGIRPAIYLKNDTKVTGNGVSSDPYIMKIEYTSYVNYGGNYLDSFEEVIATSDGGYIAVGNSNSSSYSGNTNKGSSINYDAIIVKYSKDGTEEWSKNFGGSNHDYFYGVVEDSNGYVAVGRSTSTDGDMASMSPLANNSILVKYDYTGNIVKKMIFTQTSSDISMGRKIIYNSGNYYITGYGRNVAGSGACLQYVVKYNSSFTQQWIKTYGGTNYSSIGENVFVNSSNNLVLVGRSTSTDGDMSGIKIGAQGNYDATIFVVDSSNGNVLYRGIFGGTDGADAFYNLLETSTSYIVVGGSSSTDTNMQGLNKGETDAVMVRFSKTPSTGNILPIEKITVFGGSSTDHFQKVFLNNNELTLIGHSFSINGDLNGLSKTNNSDSDGVIVKMDLNGNVISKKIYGGSQSDVLLGGLYKNNKYILVGSSFSTDIDMRNFNYGNRDAIMVTLDNNLNEVKGFNLPTATTGGSKTLVKNYGVSIPTVANRSTLKIYTTNDTTKDLGLWCTSGSIDPNGNYDFVSCLYPFDSGNIKQLHYGAISTTTTVSVTPLNNNDWIKITLSFGNSINAQISSLQIKFEGTNYVTITEAVSLGYIEPLVLTGGAHPSGNYFFPNTYNMLSGGSSGTGNYPVVPILIKPKNKLLTSITFTSATAPLIVNAYFQVQELLNFDMSLSPAL